MRILIDGIAFENLFQIGVQRFYREMLQCVGKTQNVSILLSQRAEARLPDQCSVISQKQVRESNFDVFQSTRFTASPRSTLPQVLQIHDMIPERHWDYRGNNSDVLAKREAGDAAARITCLSQATADDVKAVYPKWSDKLRVVYPGVDHLLDGARRANDRPMRAYRRPWREWMYNWRTKRAAHDLIDRSYVLFVGDRAEYKNFGIILDAMMEMNWDDEVLLAVVGRPFGEDEKAEIAKRDLQSRIKHVGKVSDARLRELYHGAVCFVFPSRAEGFGFPLLEAPLAGCAVVCSDIPVFHEIAGNFAHYCPTDDSAAWAEAVLEMAGRRKTAEEQTAARNNAMRFRWDRCAAQMLDAYREAANA